MRYEIRGVVRTMGSRSYETKDGQTATRQFVWLDCSSTLSDGLRIENVVEVEFGGQYATIPGQSGVREGDAVVVTFVPRGRLYTGSDGQQRNFTRLSGLGLVLAPSAATFAPQGARTAEAPAPGYGPHAAPPVQGQGQGYRQGGGMPW